MNPDPQEATGPAVGVTLLTRNGANMGNAIITKIVEHNNRPRIHIETDFGNVTNMFVEELEEQFTYGYVRDYDEWWNDRLELIRKGVVE